MIWLIASTVAVSVVCLGAIFLSQHKAQPIKPQLKPVNSVAEVRPVTNTAAKSDLASDDGSALVKTIADFGGKADGTTDNGPAFMKAFEFAASHPGTTLRLGGVCRVMTTQTKDGPLRMAAGGCNITNLTIEGGEVILGGPFGAFVFDHCPGLMLTNLAFDYDPPIISQGKIVSSVRKDKTITVIPDAGYPSPTDGFFTNSHDTWLTVHKPGGEYAFFFVGHINKAIPENNGRVTLSYDRPDMAAEIEGKADLRYVRVQRSYGHLNVFHFCDHLTIQQCSFYGASKFVSLFTFCNDVSLIGNRICPRDGSGRMIPTCADGFHFVGARRGPRIVGNFFDNVIDDNIVISLRGNRIKSYDGAELDLTAQSPSWYEVGDTIEVVSLQGGKGERREYQIVAMKPYKWPWQPPTMTLDRPLEGKSVTFSEKDNKENPTMVFNKSWRMDGTLICSNRFQNTRRYAVFMGAGGVRIEDNVMSNFTHAAILCSYTDNLKKKDLDYYFSSNISIARNTIVNAQNYGEGGRKFGGPAGAIDFYSFGRSSIGIGTMELMHEISICDNRIVNSGAVGIHVANAYNVSVSGNSIINPNRLSSRNRYGIWAEATSNLSVTNNSISSVSVDIPVKIDP